jgi:hypothetical protein
MDWINLAQDRLVEGSCENVMDIRVSKYVEEKSLSR